MSRGGVRVWVRVGVRVRAGLRVGVGLRVRVRAARQQAEAASDVVRLQLCREVGGDELAYLLVVRSEDGDAVRAAPLLAFSMAFRHAC